MNNAYEDGIWINEDKLAGAIYDGSLLDTGSATLTLPEARKIAKRMMYHHRNYGRVETMFVKLQEMMG